MRWITTKRGNRVLVDDYSYYKYKERRINKEDYAKICSEINTHFEVYKPGKNRLVLYSDVHKRYFKYTIYYESFDRFAIISRRKDN